MVSVGQAVQILDSCFISRHVTQKIISLCEFSIEEQCSCIVKPPYFIPEHSYSIQSLTGHNIGKDQWVGCPKETPKILVRKIAETILGQILHGVQFVDDVWIYYIATDAHKLLRLAEYSYTCSNQLNWKPYIDYYEWQCCEFQNSKLISVSGLDVFPHSMRFTCLQYIHFQNLGTQLILDLNGCPQLQELRIDNAQSLRQVSIPNCIKITYINVQRCSLLSLFDLSNQVELEHLRLDGLPISSIEVRHCTNLNYLDVDGTHIKQLSLHNLDKLKNLYCSCPYLKDLCLIGCTSLQYVRCECNIKKIDVRNLDSLDGIRVFRRTKVINVYDNTKINKQ